MPGDRHHPTNTVKVAPVDPENAELIAGEKDLVLEAVAYGKNGTTEDVEQDFDWTTSNSAVATVKKGEDGNTATVTGLKAARPPSPPPPPTFRYQRQIRGHGSSCPSRV